MHDDLEHDLATDPAAETTMSVNGGPKIPVSALADAVDAIRGADQPPADGALFDGSVFDDPRLTLKADGKDVHALEIKFGGGVALHRYAVDDVELFRELTLGKRVRFTVEGFVDGRPVSIKRNKDGVTVVSGAVIRVDSLRDLDRGIEPDEA